MEEWEGVGCQVQLSEQRMIPIVVASIIGSSRVGASPRPETLLVECLRWRDEHETAVANIRQATREFDALDDAERKAKASAFAAEILRASSTDAARNQMLYAKFANKDQWAGMVTRMLLNPGGALAALATNSADWARQHLTTMQEPELKAAVHLSEAARPLLVGFGPQLRQCLLDIFGGTVIDARNPAYDPDRFEAPA